MAFLAVVLDPGVLPVDECRQAVPVPLFEGVAAQRGAGSVALPARTDLLEKVRVLGPAPRMTPARSQMYSRLSGLTTSSSQAQTFS